MDPSSTQRIARTSLRNKFPCFVSVAVILGTLYVVSTTLPSHLNGVGLALFAGLAVACVARMRLTANGRSVESHFPAALAKHPDLLVAYNSLSHSLIEMSERSDEILRDAAAVRLAAIQEEMRTLAAGKVMFSGTEAWRTAYERVLRTPGLGRYFSVAWLRNEDYWRDAPGRHSMQLNYDLLQLGVRIERTLILNDFFWPPAATLPAKVICQWIEDQYKRGIVIRLIRESEIEHETEILSDFGIYGHRATGQLELDEQCRALRFTLDFTPQGVKLFEDRWQRLLLFAVSFRELLDRVAQGEGE